MKAFLMSLAALAIITVVAAVGLGTVNMSAGKMFTSKSGDVRL